MGSDRCDPVYSSAMQSDWRKSITEHYFHQYNNINIIIDAINDIQSFLMGREFKETVKFSDLLVGKIGKAEI